MLWVAAFMLPVANLFPFSVQRADRYLYQPSALLFLLVGIAAVQWWQRWTNIYIRSTLVCGIGLVFICLSSLTHQRTDVWMNSETLWQDHLTDYPGSPVGLFNLGIYYYHNQDFANGYHAFQKLVRLTPPDRKVHRYLARSAFEDGRYQDALRAYAGALRIWPQDKAFHNDVGYTYFRMKRYQEALQAFERAVSLAPDYHLAHENLLNIGHIAMQAKDYTLARQAFSTLLRVQPQMATASGGMCQALAGLKQMSQAVSWCQQAVRLQPANQVYLGQFALVLLRLQQPNQALHWAHRAVEAAPKWGFGHRILGDIYTALDDVQQAETAYQTALAIDPKDEVASYRLGILKQAKTK